nr:hypothetical protein [uncultured Pseudoxanthomonas sp.]
MLVTAFAVAVLAIGAYAYSFQVLPVGGPDAWSQFGNYFSGVLNPVIGIITVVLVVLTLRTTRDEAADTRKQLELQNQHLEVQAKLSEMHKRLDGVLVEWNRLMDRPAPQVFQDRHYTMIGTMAFTEKSVREILENLERRSNLIREKLAWNQPGEFAATDWNVFRRDLIPLLSELDRYCIEYEQVSGSRHLTDFYKARVREGLTTLDAAGMTPHIATARLLNQPLPDGPQSR